MREAFTMWRHTRMVVLVALCAATYAALLIPFQAIPIIPGHVSLRVANILPIAFGLLFGPAGAWGCAIGNLIGDFFGTLSPGAIGGFISNFLTGFFSYKLWSALSPRNDLEVNVTSLRRLGRYEAVAVLKSGGAYVFLTWWVTLLLGLAPAEIYFVAVIVGGLIVPMVVGPFVLRILYPRIKKWGLLWVDIMPPEEVSAGRFRRLGLLLGVVGALGGAVSMLVFLYVVDLPVTSTLVRFQPVPFFVLAFVGALLMGGRDQVEAARAGPRGTASKAEAT